MRRESCESDYLADREKLTHATRAGLFVVRTPGTPLVERTPDAVFAARLRLAALFAIGIAVCLGVHALVGGGFEVSVPAQSVEEDDAPRGDTP